MQKRRIKDISLVDLKMLHGWDEFKSKISEIKPDVAAITMMSPNYNYATQCIDIIKEGNKNINIVVREAHPIIMAFSPQSKF